MKKLTAFLVACVFLSAGVAFAADNDSHDVTVVIHPLNHLIISGGDVTLEISTVDESLDPEDDTDVSTSVRWITNSATNKKITVALSADYQTGVSLKVVASDGTGGTPSAERTLSTSAQDLITATKQEKGNRTLSYTATATEAAAPNNPAGETRTVTYTIVDQT